jgi:regulator of cell morphogenesis and NO signaling
MQTKLTQMVGALVARSPNLARSFEKLGIDYCCGGKKTLAEACREKGLDGPTVVALIEANESPAPAAIDAASMSLTELADHIEQTHHAWLRTELPRLSALIERIAARHSDKNLKLPQLPIVFAAFHSDLESHMAKEEQILFPLIRKIESDQRDGSCACGTIENPIRVMEIEHRHAGDALGLMRQITDDFSTPANACNTYRAVMHSLRELEADMHQHVHKENNVLFPRAIAATHRSEAAVVHET